MKLNYGRLMMILAACIAAFTIAFLAYEVQTERKYSNGTDGVEGLCFSGVFQTGSEEELPYSKEEILPVYKDQTTTLTGSFNKEISKGQNILFHIQNLRIKIWKNGEEIYSFGQPGSFPAFSKSAGVKWDIFDAPEITRFDVLRIELQSVYSNAGKTVYSDFMNKIMIGDSGVLFHYLLQHKGFTMFLGGLVSLAGGLLLLSLLILKWQKTPVSKRVFYFALFAIVSGMWFFYDYQIISLLIPFGVYYNIISMVCLCTMIPLLGLYVLQYIEGKSQIPLKIIIAIQLVYTLFYLVMQFLGIFDAYEVLTPYILLIIIGFLFVVGIQLYENFIKKNRKTGFIFLSSSICLLSIADISSYLRGNIPTYFASKISYSIFIVIHFGYMIYCIKKSIEKLQKTRELEEQLIQSKIDIAVSQIQPHFLYNALTAIKQLCAVDNARAEKAIGEFSNFLRGNLDSISSKTLISFDKELNHVKNYLSLEEMRFGERLKISYDIQTKDFMLPSMTIQTLVENSVRYGVTKKEQGGMVFISTSEDEGRIIITIEDNGVGFDTEKSLDDDRTHVGIANVRNRLKAQCNGTLQIESTIGKGTKAIIVMIKELQI